MNQLLAYGSCTFVIIFCVFLVIALKNSLKTSGLLVQNVNLT